MASGLSAEQFFLLWLVIDSEYDESATDNALFWGITYSEVFSAHRGGEQANSAKSRAVSILQPLLEAFRRDG